MLDPKLADEAAPKPPVMQFKNHNCCVCSWPGQGGCASSSWCCREGQWGVREPGMEVLQEPVVHTSKGLGGC